ncbi:MAG TPA: hypothetical protein VGV37_06485 [Aliidongia sp.]|uniref:hypothetical protein n=1 Tax=Aliidongia sp. TaxID=1914230 RepID=UPI002DDD5B3A|nr:hypothetical protein [Aliidongia sp.]HEV2674173.1 hypothetical protein [Aliidongia sp.]
MEKTTFRWKRGAGGEWYVIPSHQERLYGLEIWYNLSIMDLLTLANADHAEMSRAYYQLDREQASHG